jgi:hypothetical protein
MKFITAADMSNPDNLGSVLGRMGEEKKQERIKQETSQAAQEVMSSIARLSPEEQMDQATLVQIVEDVTGKYPNANKQAAVKMMVDYQKQLQGQKTFQDQQKQFGWQEENRKIALQDRAIEQGQKSNESALMGGILSSVMTGNGIPKQDAVMGEAGGDEYSVPISMLDRLQGASPEILGKVAEMMPKPIDAETQADIDYRNAQIDKINWEMNRPNAGKEKSIAEKKWEAEQAKATLNMKYKDLAEYGTMSVPAKDLKRIMLDIGSIGFDFDTKALPDDRGAWSKSIDWLKNNDPERMVEITLGPYIGPQGDGTGQRVGGSQSNPGSTTAPGPAPIEGAQWAKNPKTGQWGWHIKDQKTGQWAIVNTGGAEEPPPSTGGAPTFGPENLLRPGGEIAGEDERAAIQKPTPGENDAEMRKSQRHMIEALGSDKTLNEIQDPAKREEVRRLTRKWKKTVVDQEKTLQAKDKELLLRIWRAIKGSEMVERFKNKGY